MTDAPRSYAAKPRFPEPAYGSRTVSPELTNQSANALHKPEWHQARKELQEIEAMLPSERHGPGEIITVQLQAGVTEVGTLELEAIARGGAQRWKVELDTRAST